MAFWPGRGARRRWVEGARSESTSPLAARGTSAGADIKNEWPPLELKMFRKSCRTHLININDFLTRRFLLI